MRKKESLTEVEKNVLGELGKKLGIKFVVGSGNQKQVVLSNEAIKVKITDPELKKRLLDKRPVSYQVKAIKCGKENCTKCPHKSYVYAYWRSEKTGKVKCKYLGRLS